MKSILLAVALILVCASAARADGIGPVQVGAGIYTLNEQTFPDSLDNPGSTSVDLSFFITGPTIDSPELIGLYANLFSLEGFDTLGAPVSEHGGTEWAWAHVIFNTNLPLGYDLFISLDCSSTTPTADCTISGDTFSSGSPSPASVPEPGALSLVASALAGLGLLKRRILR